MRRYMLDTNVCIRVLDLDGGTALTERIAIEAHRQALMVSSITAAELLFGLAHSASPYRTRNRQKLAAFFVTIPVAPFDLAAAEAYGPIRSSLEKKAIGSLDLLIAAHALSLDVPIVTSNVRELRRVEGLRVEDWSD